MSYYAQESTWLAKAQTDVPVLHEATVAPLHEVAIEPDAQAFQGFSARVIGPAGAALGRTLNTGDSFVLDYGRHVVGHVRFMLHDAGPVPLDAPVRLKLEFGEVAGELAGGFDDFKGLLCRSWLQDVVFDVDYPQEQVQLPRRYAFRYLRVTVLAAYRPFRISGPECSAVTSADASAAPSGKHVAAGVHCSPWHRPMLAKIWDVCLQTLANCMQTVFEDGPKRDRRLWLGDLRLQALANYAAFGVIPGGTLKYPWGCSTAAQTPPSENQRRLGVAPILEPGPNFSLVRRCLYLFAALPYEDGFISGCVYERHVPHCARQRLLDYAMFFAPTLHDYALAGGDWETAADLWPAAARQVDFIEPCLDGRGVFTDPGGYWLFVDWKDELDKQAAIQAIGIYGLRHTAMLARRVGDRDAQTRAEVLIDRMIRGARSHLFDPARGVIVSGKDRQVSWASTAWMIIAGVLSNDEGAAALHALAQDPAAVAPATPYLWHHVIEAMFMVGMREEPLGMMLNYWGGMIARGADTFWEVYDPARPMLSPYGDYRINSYCHAWSCGPVYLIWKYLGGTPKVPARRDLLGGVEGGRLSP